MNELWSLSTKPTKKRLHEMFYEKLRILGLRAHHAKQIYTYTESVVESARSNGGKKPVLKRLTARIDKYDYMLDLENRVLVLKLHNNYDVRLKLLTPRERVEKFKEWSNYELIVKYANGEFWVLIRFKKIVKPIELKTVMATDLNFDNLTLAVFTMNGELVKLKRIKTPLRKILTHRI